MKYFMIHRAQFDKMTCFQRIPAMKRESISTVIHLVTAAFLHEVNKRGHASVKFLIAFLNF